MLHRAIVLLALLATGGLVVGGVLAVPSVRAEKVSNSSPATVAVATLQGSQSFPAAKGRAFFLSATRDGQIVSRFGVQVLDLPVPAGTELDVVVGGQALDRTMTVDLTRHAHLELKSDSSAVPTDPTGKTIQVRLHAALSQLPAGTVLASGTFGTPPRPTGLSATLAGAAGFTRATGMAAFGSSTHDGQVEKRLGVHVESVDAPGGTPLEVWVDGQKLARGMTLEASHQASVELQSARGDTVPTIAGGAHVEVKLGDDRVAGKPKGTVVVAGTFGAPPPPPTTTSLQADLAGATGFADAVGTALYLKVIGPDGTDTRLTVFVRKVSLPNGTPLDVYVDGQKLSQGMTVNHESNGYLELQSGRGATVPTINAGSLVQVKNGSTLVASATFHSVGP
jgi:hypothetical protein